MLNNLQNPLAFIGRLMLVWFFLPAGISKITGFAGTVQYITSVGLPMPSFGAVIAIAVEVLCGLALLVGFGTRVAALILAIFTLAASFFFHAYWNVPADSQFIVSLLFNKNMGLVGGLLVLAAFGGGAWSLDARSGK
mgnify:CR=1 FL=1